jgi:predicted lactoylglutathione lyase
MPRKIFVNLPVKDLQKTMDFYAALGFTYNMQFTNDKAACMVISEDIYAMLLTEPMFKSFIKKEISDAKTTTVVLLALSADTREEVDDMVNKAIGAGGSQGNDIQDHGFMYSNSFQDLDGHIWEIFWMDINAAPPHPEN